MQDPNDEQIKKLIAAGLSDEDIIFYMKNQSKFSTQSQGGILNTLRGVGNAIKETASDVIANPGNVGRGFLQGAKNEALKIADSFQQLQPETRLSKELGQTRGNAPINRMLGPQTNVDLGKAGALGGFVGSVAADLPLMGGINAGIGNLGEKAIASMLPEATSAFGRFGVRAAASLPKNIAGGVVITAITNPDEVSTPKGVAKVAALSSIGSIFDGIFGKMPLSAAEPSVPSAQAFTDLVEQAKVDPQKAIELKNKIDDFTSQFSRLSNEDPLNRRVDVLKPREQGFKLWTTDPQPMQKYKGIEIGPSDKARAWEPGRKTVPNSIDVQGYAEELSADLKQRDKINTKIMRIMNNVQDRGTHSYDQLAQLPKLLEQEAQLTNRINETLPKIGKSAEEVRGLIGGVIKDENGRTIPVNIRRQEKPNMANPIPTNEPPPPSLFKTKNPPMVGSPLKPGSGTQSPYPFTREPDIDPLAPILKPKVEGSGNNYPNLSDEENAIASKIDFGNEASNAARREERYLLDTPMKRLDYKAMDFLKPIREASPEAGDIAEKYLRVNMRLQQAVDDALYIPDGKGGYARGPESLVPLIRELGSDGDILNRFQIYAHARQAISGVDTPFSVSEAQKVVDRYASEFPEIVKAYETRHQPLVNGLLDAAQGYGLTTPEAMKAMREATDYVSLTRSAFGDPYAATGFLKGRTNPGSQKLVGDYFHNMMANIRGVVKAGERAQVLRELVKARQANPNLADIIEVIPYQPPEGLSEVLAKLPPDTPEVVKKAVGDVYAIPPKGNVFPLIVDGQRVSVKVNPELASALDQMQFRGPKVYNPENAGTIEKMLSSPLNVAAKVEKATTSVYSVYRDMFGFGVPVDAIEIATNASARGYKFNLLKSPVKGFFALYNDDPALRDLIGHGGGLGFRYANPMAEKIIENADDLVKLAKTNGIKLRVMNPGKAFIEFAGNLSNASRAGLVLENLDRPMSELASLYNNIIGDPALRGAALSSVARFTGFMNYPLQANRAQLSALARSPQRLGFFLARAGGMLTAPAIATWYMTKDNKAVQEMSKDPNGRRFTYLPNPSDPNELFAVPKPQGIAGVLFVTLPQMMMEELRDSGNTKVMEEVGKAAVQSLVPNIVPLTVNTAIGVATGKSLNVNDMSVRDVVPGSRQGTMAEDAGGSMTTNTAKALAAASGIDAGKWDQVLRSLMIGTSFNAFQQADYAMGDKKGAPPPNSFTMIPGIRAVEASKAGSRYLQEFYDKLGKVSEPLKSFNLAVANGQVGRATLVYQGNKSAYQEAIRLAGYADQMKTLNQQMNTVRYSEMYSADEKKEKIRNIEKQRIDIAKRALGVQ